MTRRVVIAGGRNFTDRVWIDQVMRNHLRESDTVVTGGASGVDQVAHEIAEAWSMATEIVPAEWRDSDGKMDKSAGPRRNAIMAENSDVLIAVWNGKSTGTKNMIDNALRCNLEVHVYKYPKDW